MPFWKHSPGHERALRSTSTEIGVGVAGSKHGNQWYYQQIQVFIDTSCLKPVQTASNEGAPNKRTKRHLFRIGSPRRLSPTAILAALE
jgi:hypothetical protein